MITINTITLVWLSLPFLIGFSAYLFPKLDRFFALFVSVVSAGYAFKLFTEQSSITLQLLDSFGVTLMVDELSAYFILTNALVTLAVILEQHWNGALFSNRETMLSWAKTMKWKGIKPIVHLSQKIYQKGISLTKKAMGD